MNQQHGAQALTILWTEPVNSNTPPAWDGPSPFSTPEPEPAPAFGGLAGAWDTWAASQEGSSDSAPEAANGQGNESLPFNQGAQQNNSQAFNEDADGVANQPASSGPQQPGNDAFAPPQAFTPQPAAPSSYEQGPAQPFAQPDQPFGQPAQQQAGFQPEAEASAPSVESAPGASTGSHVFTGQESSWQDDARQESPSQPSPHAFEPGAPQQSQSPAAPPELPANEGLAEPDVSPLPEPASEPSVDLSKGANDAGADVDGAPTSLSGPPSGQNNDDIPEDALTIGRSRNNGIVLDDMLVSRQHVMITADDEGLLLRDLGSRNGTYVNGQRVEQTHLHEGDRIGIGQSTFEVRDGWLVSV